MYLLRRILRALWPLVAHMMMKLRVHREEVEYAAHNYDWGI
jgi:hypothetical protein